MSIRDERFQIIEYDPKFRKKSKQKMKIPLDSRFKNILQTDKRFNSTIIKDKFGRKLLNN